MANPNVKLPPKTAQALKIARRLVNWSHRRKAKKAQQQPSADGDVAQNTRPETDKALN